MYVVDWSAIAIVLATCAGPIFAVWASEQRQHKRQIKDRQEWVFRTLMTTRSTRLSMDHISALNHIDFAFPQKEHPLVADAWGLYNAHLNSSQGETEDSLDRWVDTGYNLLVDLLHLMANDLKIPFPKTSIKKNAYYPKWHASIEAEQNELRALLLELLKNQRSLNLNATVYPPPQQAGEIIPQKEM